MCWGKCGRPALVSCMEPESQRWKQRLLTRYLLYVTIGSILLSLYNTRTRPYYYRELSTCLFNSAHFNFNLTVKQRKDDSQSWWWCHWGGKGQGTLTEEHFGYSVKALCEHLHVSRVGPAACFLGHRHQLWTSAGEGFEPQLFEIKTLLRELVVVILPSAMSLLTSFHPMSQLWCYSLPYCYSAALNLYYFNAGKHLSITCTLP